MTDTLGHRLKAFLDHRGGNAATVMALCALPVLAAIGGAIELGSIASERGALQDAVDAGALAGAARKTVSSGNTQNAPDIAIATAQRTLNEAHVHDVATFSESHTASSLTLTATVRHQSWTGILGAQTLTATATAETLAAIPLCVLQTGTGTMLVKNTARIRATGCAVHANGGIAVDTGAMVQANRTQAVGTIAGPVSPAGNAGAVAIDDPFGTMDLTPPVPCAGKANKVVVQTAGVLFLPAGVHCQEIQIQNNAALILQPGEHYFMNELSANGTSSVTGDDVVLIFGSDDGADFADKAIIRLGARKTGRFAGFLIATTRDNTETFRIASDQVSKLLGTIYIPNAQLLVETSGSVAQDSAWSIIVANNIQLAQNPVLVINDNYSGSGVPVPQGVGPGRTAPVLSH